MTKTQYKKARQIIRENGYYGLRWLSSEGKAIMTALRDQGSDKLKVRQDVVNYCNREGYSYNFTTLANRLD